MFKTFTSLHNVFVIKKLQIRDPGWVFSPRQGNFIHPWLHTVLEEK